MTPAGVSLKIVRGDLKDLDALAAELRAAAERLVRENR